MLHVQGLVKKFGNLTAVGGIDLTIERGELVGLLGPNGAGKTTTIRMLCGVLEPDAGDIKIDGVSLAAAPVRAKARIGWLAEGAPLPGEFRVSEYLASAAAIRGIPREAIGRWADRCQIDTVLRRRISQLSRGFRQRVALAAAMLHDPAVLVLDEPTIGLDPLMQQEFYHLLAEVSQEGRTVFLSSHIMPEVERVCDRVAIIREGRVVAVEDVATLKSRALRRLEIHFAGPVSAERFNGIDGVRDVTVQDSILSCTVVGELDALVKAAAESHVVNLISQEPSLEEVFLTYYQGGDNAG